MGHTHYTELANDVQLIYAATRSTGQLEEGPPGLCPITSPADYRLITRPESINHVVRGMCETRAKVWPKNPFVEVLCPIDDGRHLAMEFLGGI